MSGNPNYQQTQNGWERKPGAPDAKHPSRINWSRLDSVTNAREGVSKQREIQNQRNEEHKRKHGDG